MSSLHLYLKVTDRSAWRDLIQSLLTAAEAFLTLMLYFNQIIGSKPPQRLPVHFTVSIPYHVRHRNALPPLSLHTY